MANLRGLLFGALSGRPNSDVSGKADGDVKGMLLAVGGASDKTRSGIDLTSAAKALGVSRRTVERWVRSADSGTGQRPSKEHQTTLARASRQRATTKAGRAQTLAGSSRMQRMARHGGKVRINAFQGPMENKYKRLRTVEWDLSAAEAREMMAAYEARGDAGFMAWAQQFGTENYVPDWQIGDVEGLSFS